MKTPRPRPDSNVDAATVRGFGQEWQAFDQSGLGKKERRRVFDSYFGICRFDGLGEGFDFGCGSGRWAALIAPKVGRLHCIDASAEALAVARRNLADRPNVRFHQSGAEDIPLPDGSQDFGYSLGVLHHVPDTETALRSCVAKLKPGAPFLLYLYYKLDGRPAWFRGLWQLSDLARRLISRLPFGLRKCVTDVIAATVYWPLARSSGALERLGVDVANAPLGFYRQCSFYMMRTDALDRFGTRLEQRFARPEIEALMRRAGLVDIQFSDAPPYWVACGRRALFGKGRRPETGAAGNVQPVDSRQSG